MTALIRYTLGDFARSLRWIGPLLLFAMSQAILDANAGGVLPTYAASAAVLFFVSTWLSVAVANCEDPLQVDITIAVAGSRTKVGLAKLATSYLCGVVLIAVAIAIPPFVAANARLTASQFATGLSAQLLTTLGGVAFGTLCGRPVIKRTALALLLGSGGGLLDSIFPGSPPVGQLMTLLSEARPHRLALLLSAIAAETVVCSAVVVILSFRIARARA